MRNRSKTTQALVVCEVATLWKHYYEGCSFCDILGSAVCKLIFLLLSHTVKENFKSYLLPRTKLYWRHQLCGCLACLKCDVIECARKQWIQKLSKTHQAKVTVTFVKEQNIQVLAHVATVHIQSVLLAWFCWIAPEFRTASTVHARGGCQKFLDAQYIKICIKYECHVQKAFLN